MKKNLLLLPIICVFAYFTLTSSQSGSTGNYTGIHGAGYTGCGSSNVCHGRKSNDVTVTFLLEDSAGNAMLKYIPGKRHRIKMVAINMGSDNLPKFGFQLSAVTGVASAYNQAGSYYRPSLPVNTILDTSVNPYLFQQSANLSPTTGTGSFGSIYNAQITWVAPPAGTGKVSVFGVACLVNGNSAADTLTDKWNNTVYDIDEDGPVNVKTLSAAGITTLSAWPIPVSNALHLHTTVDLVGFYTIQVFSLTGINVCSLYVAGADFNTGVIDATNWAPGMYSLVIKGEGATKVLPVIKD